MRRNLMKLSTAQWILGAGLLFSFGLAGGVGVSSAQAQTSSNADAQIQSDATKALSNKKFQDVKATVENGVVTLNGTVSSYSDKKDAENKVHHRKNVQSVQNNIQVAGPSVSDEELQAKLSQKLVYDRVGYGTTAFNAFTIGVHDGIVTLGGTAYAPTDRNSAVNLVENYPGVKGLVDNIKIAPTSGMDDRIRVATARAVYGAPQLNRYALDPAKPIRISVENGNVTLSGMVDSQGDKDVAGIRANSVSGVFKVTNNLQVVGQRANR